MEKNKIIETGGSKYWYYRVLLMRSGAGCVKGTAMAAVKMVAKNGELISAQGEQKRSLGNRNRVTGPTHAGVVRWWSIFSLP